MLMVVRSIFYVAYLMCFLYVSRTSSNSRHSGPWHFLESRRGMGGLLSPSTSTTTTTTTIQSQPATCKPAENYPHSYCAYLHFRIGSSESNPETNITHTQIRHTINLLPAPGNYLRVYQRCASSSPYLLISISPHPSQGSLVYAH
ncbi:hypothetical protein E2C01_024770 [Portunus trituberculatus]|uniref:Uncharacterized protein n=1 Tax=Portunus trituberculatus TaxID=210409 RepID=A0A5B7EB67_PORTR|nr:hypothetical protein [Portunus trituberculatus]